MSVNIKRVYDQAGPSDGRRFLVDRLWPRGFTRESLHMEAWLKELAPSEELRRQFGHDHSRWSEFQGRYWEELDARPEALKPLLEAVQQGPVTLLYAAKDRERNNAVALKAYLEQRLSLKPPA